MTELEIACCGGSGTHAKVRDYEFFAVPHVHPCTETIVIRNTRTKNKNPNTTRQVPKPQ